MNLHKLLFEEGKNYTLLWTVSLSVMAKKNGLLFLVHFFLTNFQSHLNEKKGTAE